MYIYDRKQWPKFSWDQAKIADLLLKIRHSQGRLLGRMDALGFQLREEATLQILTQDALKTSEIEGEKLDISQVRSSIATRLAMDIGALPHVDRHVEGIVEITLDATQNFAKPLTNERLFKWHQALFPVKQSLFQRMTIGKYRGKQSGPIQVVSGAYGREKIHYEAPSHDRLKKEMSQFIKWFNVPAEMDLLIKSALAHFWFVTIHPFDDGNGRIARAIADMVLARSENSQQRFYSMSAQIRHERKAYYQVLEECQKGSLDITTWIEWFLDCMQHAIIASEETLQMVMSKARFWALHQAEPFNDRQRDMINRILNGFYGKLTSSKWAKLTKCSQDTALRDINDLLQRQILKKEEAGGRSTHYQLCVSQ